MGHRDVVGIDMIGHFDGRTILRQMRDDLMPVKIKVDPSLRASALFTAENAAIELAGGVKVIYRKGEVKKILHTVRRPS